MNTALFGLIKYLIQTGDSWNCNCVVQGEYARAFLHVQIVSEVRPNKFEKYEVFALLLSPHPLRELNLAQFI